MQSDVSIQHPPLPPREAVIPGFPAYKVNTQGQVWSKAKRGPGGIEIWRPLTAQRRLSKDQKGGCYWLVWLKRYGFDKKHFGYRIRDLVAITFIGPKPPDSRLRSLDRDPLNHALENLRYMTAEEIKASGIDADHYERSFNYRKLTPEKVAKIRRDIADGKSFRSVAKEHDITRQNVRAVVSRQTWQKVDDGIPAYIPGSRMAKTRAVLTQADKEAIASRSIGGERPGLIAKDFPQVHPRYIGSLAAQARRAACLPRLKTGPRRKPPAVS